MVGNSKDRHVSERYYILGTFPLLKKQFDTLAQRIGYLSQPEAAQPQHENAEELFQALFANLQAIANFADRYTGDSAVLLLEKQKQDMCFKLLAFEEYCSNNPSVLIPDTYAQIKPLLSKLGIDIYQNVSLVATLTKLPSLHEQFDLLATKISDLAQQPLQKKPENAMEVFETLIGNLQEIINIEQAYPENRAIHLSEEQKKIMSLKISAFNKYLLKNPSILSSETCTRINPLLAAIGVDISVGNVKVNELAKCERLTQDLYDKLLLETSELKKYVQNIPDISDQDKQNPYIEKMTNMNEKISEYTEQIYANLQSMKTLVSDQQDDPTRVARQIILEAIDECQKLTGNLEFYCGKIISILSDVATDERVTSVNLKGDYIYFLLKHFVDVFQGAYNSNVKNKAVSSLCTSRASDIGGIRNWMLSIAPDNEEIDFANNGIPPKQRISFVGS
jgi:hypothetical protein